MADTLAPRQPPLPTLERPCSTLVFKSAIATAGARRIKTALANDEKGTCIQGGALETIIAKRSHPARESLIWNNLFFGPPRRKGVRIRPDWEAGNSPFCLHLEVIDEVGKFVFVHKSVADGVRVFARQKAAENAREVRATKKVAKAARTV